MIIKASNSSIFNVKVKWGEIQVMYVMKDYKLMKLKKSLNSPTFVIQRYL